MKTSKFDHILKLRLNDLQYDYIIKFSKLLNINSSQFIRMILDNIIAQSDIENTFNLEFNDASFDDFNTVKDVIDYIEANQK